MSDTPAVKWDRFSNDPRSPHNAPLRASDLDRSVALDALGSAFADGRLDREEYDERSDRVQTSKTLGELLTPLRDLAPDPASGAMVRSSPSQLQAGAEQQFARARQQAFSRFLIPSLICWVIWAVTLVNGGGTGVPWPVFVTLFTAIRPIQMVLNKQAMIESERQKIQRREQRRIEERPR
ncbi:MAG: DUF1707 domain-containing protein [Marmoricola sp.]